jgi:hypothetical protein
MKWLFNVVIKFLTWDDPKITPIPVRASFALLMMAIGVIIACSHALRPSLAACGIVLGVLATGILHWTRIASDQDLQRIKNEIAKIGSSTKLSIRDSASVIAIAHLSFVMAYLLSVEGVLIAQYHPSQFKLPIWLALVGIWMIYFHCPAILDYLGRKMGRSLCSRWRVRLQEDILNAEIKRILSLISFVIVVVAGVLALQNVLL